MVGKTERVVLVKGNSTRWFEQAIFIVNKSAEAERMPVDFIAEAERIIEEFNLKNATLPADGPPPPPVIKKPAVNSFWTTGLMILASVAITGIFAFQLFR